jgi:2-polyprenyl-3-methyl-5-hydroxy-6-metoxy-1,4-benzoquinol methylase
VTKALNDAGVPFDDARCALLWSFSDALALREVATRRPDILPREAWQRVEAQYDRVDQRMHEAPTAQTENLVGYVDNEFDRGVTATLRWLAAWERISCHVGAKDAAAGKTILDFACHAGGAGVLMSDLYPDVRVHLMDRCEALRETMALMVERHARHPEHLTISVGDEFDLPVATYDVVFAGEVLEHCWDWQATVAAWEAACKPGGRVVVTTPLGPWEACDPQRCHVMHWETADIIEAFGMKPGFGLTSITRRDGPGAMPFGWSVYSWVADGERCGVINWQRKLATVGIEV